MGSLVSGLWYFIYGAGLVCIGFSVYFWKATLYKAQLYAQALQYLALSGDNKWKVTDVPDPASFADDSKWTKRKVIFVRHGESNWNETFNRGFNPIFFIPRVLWACGFELYLLLQGVRDSWFYDSSLSPLGLKQTESLRKAVFGAADHPDLLTLAGKGQPSVIVSSPLRRAMSTAIYGMYDRLEKDEEKILILPCLQEISRNMDTLPLTPPYANPQPSWIEAADKNANMVKMYRDRVDVTQYTGNKAVKSTGLARLLAFNQWLFNHGGSNDVVVVSGHSLWFRSFFKTFLARASTHKAKDKKMKNCAVVSLTVMSDGTYYKIDEQSITEVHLGFE